MTTSGRLLPVVRRRFAIILVLTLAVVASNVGSQLRTAIEPASLTGFGIDSKWFSVSNGEPEPSVGLRWFTRRQIMRLSEYFPHHRMLAASVADRIPVEVDGQSLNPNLQFIKPDNFALSGIRLLERAIARDDSSFCVPSARWVRRTGIRDGWMTLGTERVRLFGQVDASFAMFAGTSAVDIWCSWDLASGLLAGVTNAVAEDVPLYWLYVGADDDNAEAEWRSRSLSIELPRVMGRGSELHQLKTLPGMVNHPAIQAAALARIDRIASMAAVFLAFGICFTLFVAQQQLLKDHKQWAIRYVLGARPAALVKPTLAEIAVAFLVAMMLGTLAATAVVRLLWRDATLAEARFSGAIDGFVVGWPGIIIAAGLSLLAVVIECTSILRLANASRFDVNSKAALPGVRRLHLSTAILCGFSFIAAWGLVSQLPYVGPPEAADFGIGGQPTLFLPRFAPDFPVFERSVRADQLHQLTGLLSEAIGGAPVAVTETMPGSSGANFPGALNKSDGSECGISAEILRTNEAFPAVAGMRLVSGRFPKGADELALSARKARQCFGDTQRALSQQLIFGDRARSVVGVYDQFDWNLGSSASSEFMVPLSPAPLTYFFVARAGTDPDQIQRELTQRLRELQPRILSIDVQSLDDISAQLHRAEIIQARLLASASAALAFACLLAAGMVFAVTYSGLKSVLALHLALGATPIQLIRRQVASLLTSGASLILILAAMRWLAADRLSFVSAVFAKDASLILSGATISLAVMAAIAARTLVKLVRNPGLASELTGE
jgi:hypothetical protein